MPSTTPQSHSGCPHQFTLQCTQTALQLHVALSGEADISTLPQLDSALASIEPDDATPVYLDLCDLTFADAATMRRLAVFAEKARRDGGQVHTRSRTRMLWKIAVIMQIHDVLGIQRADTGVT